MVVIDLVHSNRQVKGMDYQVYFIILMVALILGLTYSVWALIQLGAVVLWGVPIYLMIRGMSFWDAFIPGLVLCGLAIAGYFLGGLVAYHLQRTPDE